MVIGNASVSVSSATGFVGIGQQSAISQLDVAGGVRALSGLPTATLHNVGYSFSSDGSSGMVLAFFFFSPSTHYSIQSDAVVFQHNGKS